MILQQSYLGSESIFDEGKRIDMAKECFAKWLWELATVKFDIFTAIMEF